MKANSYKGQSATTTFSQFRLQRGMAFGVIIITALLAFEIFNYSTTDFALTDLLGDLTFLGVRWATILSIAFCGIDFAGIARLFTPDEGAKAHNESLYLFGAWLLAATMNAMLTWWGVSIAVMSHESLGNDVVARDTLLRVVPIFVAVLVWLVRVLIIGTFSVAGDRLFSQSEQHMSYGQRAPKVTTAPMSSRSLGNHANAPRTASASSRSFRPAPKPASQLNTSHTQPDPTYHPLTMNAAPKSSARANQQPAARKKYGSR